jgi:hypothetical protein
MQLKGNVVVVTAQLLILIAIQFVTFPVLLRPNPGAQVVQAVNDDAVTQLRAVGAWQEVEFTKNCPFVH